METKEMIQILTYAVMFIVAVITILAGVLFVMWIKKRQKNAKPKETKVASGAEPAKSTSLGVDKQSIFNFMEFDTIDDNMIIQNNGERFLMVIECQGVNYDLMSGVEKAGVEEGFVQFLNTLRSSIQIYIQTRSVNLENSISTYKEKLRKVEDKLNRMKMQYYQMQESGEYTKEQLDKAFYELTKQSNLYEYGRDVINDTERMSLNKNVLNKKYYIIVPFYAAELGGNDYDKAETKSLAFSEIYTRAQSLIRSISACGVRGKILRTNELIELLYMAYNRDEAETFGLAKAIQAGYDEVNSTAPDVLDKKMSEIDKYIDQKAFEKAQEMADRVLSEKEKAVLTREQNMNDLINEMAQAIIQANEQYIGKDVAEESIRRLNEEAEKEEKTKEKKGGEVNGKKVSRTRGRKSIKQAE